MKTIAIALLGLLSLPSFATSPMHPYAKSVDDMIAVLRDGAVQKKLSSYSLPVSSLTSDKLRNGNTGWVVTTEKCALEVDVTYVNIGKPHPSIPGGHHTKRVITVLDCR